MIHACLWLTNVLCVVFLATTLVLFFEKRFLHREALAFPTANAGLGILAGLAGWCWFAKVDVMYADAALPLLVNPIALHLFHSRAWADLYPSFGPNRWIHFLILPSLIGILGGSFMWWLVGTAVERAARFLRLRPPVTTPDTPSPQ